MSAPNPFQPGYSQPQPVGQKETFGTRPGDVGEPNTSLALVAIVLLAGISIVSCGGLGYFFARQGQEPEIAQARPAAQQPPVQQPVAKPQRKSNVKVKVSPPGPEMPPPVPSPPPPPTNFTPPPSFTPPGFTPPPPFVPPPAPQLPPAEAPLTPFEARRPTNPVRPPNTAPQTDDEKLTAIVQQLSDPKPARPLFFPLVELERLPAQERRREEVAKALEPHFAATDISTLIHLTKVAAIWGAEVNAGSLTRLIDHENTLVRWQAARALAKVSPSAETAEKLAAKIGEPASASALRDAFQALGEIGEIALLRRLDDGNVSTRREAVALLGDIGTEISRPVLEKVAEADADFGVKSRAKRAIRQLDERKMN